MVEELGALKQDLTVKEGNMDYGLQKTSLRHNRPFITSILQRFSVNLGNKKISCFFYLLKDISQQA